MDDERQLNRLIRLVEDMLDVSRISTGRITYSAEEFDLCELAKDVTSRYASQFEAAGVTVRVEAPGPVIGKWDRYRLEQVIVNLLTNALKYGAGQPVEITVSKRPGYAVLAVRDHGLGIPAQDHARIFEQFERAVSGNSISGLGLGLFISRKIVEAHHGTIQVESKEGHGSTFIVELPLDPLWNTPAPEKSGARSSAQLH
jgi:signal transduction histidine kinase